MARFQCLSAFAALTGLLAIGPLGCGDESTETDIDEDGSIVAGADSDGEESIGATQQGLCTTCGDLVFNVGLNLDGRYEVFGLGANRAVFSMAQTGVGVGTWSSWNWLGGSLVAAPASITGLDGSVSLFGLGVDNSLWYSRRAVAATGVGIGGPGGLGVGYGGLAGFSSWISLGGALASRPVATAFTDGRIGVFARGVDGALWSRSQLAGGGWSTWGSLGGALAGVPAVATAVDGNLWAFSRGIDGGLWYSSQLPGGAWANWATLGGSIVGNPVVARGIDGRFSIFARGLNNSLLFARQSLIGGWTGWNTLATNLIADPYLTAGLDGRYTVFGLGADNALWYSTELACGAGGACGVAPVITGCGGAACGGVGPVGAGCGAPVVGGCVGAGCGAPVVGGCVGAGCGAPVVTGCVGAGCGAPVVGGCVGAGCGGVGAVIGGWGAWTSLGGSLGGLPIATAGVGGLAVFAPGLDRRLWGTSLLAGGAAWNPWSPIGTALY